MPKIFRVQDYLMPKILKRKGFLSHDFHYLVDSFYSQDFLKRQKIELSKSQIFRRQGFLIHIFSEDMAFLAIEYSFFQEIMLSQIFTIPGDRFPRSLESVDRKDLLSHIHSEDLVLQAYIFRRQDYSEDMKFLAIDFQEINLSQPYIFRTQDFLSHIYSEVRKI